VTIDHRGERTLGVVCLKQRLDSVGWAVLPHIAVGVSSESVARELGEPLAPLNGALVQRLTPKAASTPNTYSGIFGLGRFPFHTDLAHWPVPPRYLLLRCVVGYGDVPTMLLDGRAVAEEVGSETMARALVRPRRPRRGEFRLLRLRQQSAEGDIIRWDEVYLKPASPVGQDVSERIQAYLETCQSTPVAMVADGDVLVLDNWRILHSRPAISEDRRERRLERVYLRSLR